MVSLESRIYYEELLKGKPFGSQGFNLAELREGMATRREPTTADVSIIPAQIGTLSGDWVLTPGADPDFRLLYLHGGGYISGAGAFYYPLAAHISTAAHCAVLLPDYRLAPEQPFPAGLEDCIYAYEWMLGAGPYGFGDAKAAVIGGDSAGGGLTLATLLALRDRQRPLPAAGFGLSPFTNLTLSGDSIRSEGKKDPIMDPACLPVFVELYLGKTDAHTPLASPVFGDYHGIPPLLIQVGEHEIIRDDSVEVAARARQDGVDVTLEIWDGMFHVFQSHDPLLPEAHSAIEHIANFMRSHLYPDSTPPNQ